ncbi:MAG: hypothetical protein DMG79_08225 [Acidobacteria bacterium]|nr:MAG: hypothetical protein DMG79_08225 [Acidobacteriota bacterium]
MAAVAEAPPIPAPAPPSCSECASKTQPASGAPPTQSASRMWRSGDGKTRIDTPTTSVISDPAAQHTIVLDHAKKEATVIPMAPAGSAPVEELGKSTIEGHEVEGKRYTLPPTPPLPKPQLPKPPAMSKVSVPGAKMPTAPASPKAPQAPAAPVQPKLPPKPSVTEVWTSVKLKTPVLTKVSTAAGEQTTYCKPTETAEHPPSVFQIPQGYKIKPKL